jgi:hypothetical protein
VRGFSIECSLWKLPGLRQGNRQMSKRINQGPNQQDPPPIEGVSQAESPYFRLIVGIVVANPQMELFPSDEPDPGASARFVHCAFSSVLPILKELGHEGAALLRSGAGLGIELRQTTTAKLISLQLALTKRGDFSQADEAQRQALAVALQPRLADAMARIASSSPLVRTGIELKDTLLTEVALIKQRGIPASFAYGMFTMPVKDPMDLAMSKVEARKRSTYLQPGTPEEVRIPGAAKVSHRGERLRIARVDGAAAVAAYIDHGDPLVYAAHAVAAGGVATFVLERSVEPCKMAPEIQRETYRLVDIIVDDESMIPHLKMLIEAATGMVESFKPKRSSSRKRPSGPDLSDGATPPPP